MANGTLKVQNIETSSGSGTITLGQSGETITAPTGVTVSGGISNKDYFAAKLSSNQAYTNNVVAIIQFDATLFDTGSNFDTSNYYYVIPTAGKYFFSTGVYAEDSGDFDKTEIWIKKNGNQTQLNCVLDANGDEFQTTKWGISGIIDCAVNDEISVYARQRNSSGGNYISGDTNTFFQGFRIIG